MGGCGRGEVRHCCQGQFNGHERRDAALLSSVAGWVRKFIEARFAAFTALGREFQAVRSRCVL